MKSEHQQRVEEFMRLAGQDIPDRPTIPSVEVRMLRARLILEEAMETIERGLGVFVYAKINDYESFQLGEGGAPLQFMCASNRQFDLVETIDGCCDLSVVTVGTLSAIGVSDTPFLEEIDANNLAKFGPGGYRDEGGKWCKPPGHKPPDIAGILESLR